VLSRVQQHVRERSPHLAWRAEHAVVVAAVENRSTAAKDAVDRPRETRSDALQPIAERMNALRLDQQVDVVVLERVVDDPEARTARDLTERALHLAHQPHRSQGRHVGEDAHRHQAWQAPGKPHSPSMPHARPGSGLASRARPRAAPARRHREIQLELSTTRHTLDCGYVLRRSQEEFDVGGRKSREPLALPVQDSILHESRRRDRAPHAELASGVAHSTERRS
jgi:hypothetical protein